MVKLFDIEVPCTSALTCYELKEVALLNEIYSRLSNFFTVVPWDRYIKLNSLVERAQKSKECVMATQPISCISDK